MKVLGLACGLLRSLHPRQHLRERQCAYLFTTAHKPDFDCAVAGRCSLRLATRNP